MILDIHFSHGYSYPSEIQLLNFNEFLMKIIVSYDVEWKYQLEDLKTDLGIVYSVNVLQKLCCKLFKYVPLLI